MDTFTIHIAHIHADMLTNPTDVHLYMTFTQSTWQTFVRDMLRNHTVVQLHVKMHVFYTIHNANLVTDMLTNPTLVHLHVKMNDVLLHPHRKPCNRHAYKPYSCSLARENG